jgi:hypothetical protein
MSGSTAGRCTDMSRATIRIEVCVAWWLHWYLLGVAWMSWLSGMQPDPEKVSYWAGKAIKAKVVR